MVVLRGEPGGKTSLLGNLKATYAMSTKGWKWSISLFTEAPCGKPGGKASMLRHVKEGSGNGSLLLHGSIKGT